MRRDLLVDMSYKRIMHLSVAIPGGGGGGVNLGNPRSFAQRPLQISPTQNQDCLTKSFQRPSPGGKEVCSATAKGAIF